MKILLLNSIGRNKFGGGEKWVISAAKGLQDAGHTVYLGCRSNSMLESRARERGIAVRNFNVLSDFSPYNIIKLTQLLKTENIDVVLSKNREFGIAGIAGYFANTPLVVARHGLPLRRKISKHKFLLNKFADGIIVNAASTKEMYVENGWFPEDFVKIIYNGIDLNTSCDPMPFETMYPGKKIIVSTGRLSAQKGFSYLIDAAAILKQKRDDVMIIVLGEGKLRESLMQRARTSGVDKMIQFPGFVKAVGPYLKGCDLFTLPSLYEGLSNAAIEAMAFGKPAILSDVNGAREIVTDGVNGVIVPPRDADSLANAMHDLLSDEEKRVTYGKKASSYVQEVFSIDKMVRKLEAYFEKKLKAKNH